MARKRAEEEQEGKAAAATTTAAAEEKCAVVKGRDGDAPSPTPPAASQVPALFEDEAWEVLNHVILSTRSGDVRAGHFTYIQRFHPTDCKVVIVVFFREINALGLLPLGSLEWDPRRNVKLWVCCYVRG